MLWWEVIRIMAKNPRRVGFYLPLTCEKHNNATFVQDAEGIEDLNGGCSLPCQGNLSCGHHCVLKCHPYSHDDITCQKPCTRVLGCGHTCTQLCYLECKSDCECQAVNQLENQPISYAKATSGSLKPERSLRPRQYATARSSTLPDSSLQSRGKGDNNRIQSSYKQSFRDYIEGGYDKSDQAIADSAHKHAVDAQLQRLDAENAAALFSPCDDTLLAGEIKGMKLVRTKDDGRGGKRGVWTGTYAPPQRENTVSKKEEASLIDL